MAVETVYIPLTFKYDPIEARFDADYKKAQADKSVAKREEAQAQLNALLEQGYTVVTQTNVDTRTGIDLAIVLHKPDAETATPILKDHQRNSVHDAQQLVASWMDSDLNNFKQFIIRFVDVGQLEQMLINLATILPKREV